MNQTILWFLEGYEKMFYVGMTLIMLSVFFVAYFNNYEVLVVVNDYGEAKVEFIALLLSIGVIVFNNVRRLRRG